MMQSARIERAIVLLTKARALLRSEVAHLERQCELPVEMLEVDWGADLVGTAIEYLEKLTAPEDAAA